MKFLKRLLCKHTEVKKTEHIISETDLFIEYTCKKCGKRIGTQFEKINYRRFYEEE